MKEVIKIICLITVCIMGILIVEKFTRRTPEQVYARVYKQCLPTSYSQLDVSPVIELIEACSKLK